MSNRRDYISEIMEYNKRLPSKSHRFSLSIARWMQIDTVFKFVLNNMNSPISEEIKRYLPVASIAFLQGYFRLLIRDIVNLGEPYVKRCDNFINNKMNISEIWNLIRSQTTLGELVAHLIDLNNIDQINSLMSRILDEDFLFIVRKYNESEEDKRNKYFEGSYQRLAKTFRLRNIFCHELATNLQNLDENDIADVVLSPANFFWQTEMAIIQHITGLGDHVFSVDKNK